MSTEPGVTPEDCRCDLKRGEKSAPLLCPKRHGWDHSPRVTRVTRLDGTGRVLGSLHDTGAKAPGAGSTAKEPPLKLAD